MNNFNINTSETDIISSQPVRSANRSREKGYDSNEKVNTDDESK
jgi:hypothetical protein